MAAVILYITASSKDEAITLAKSLVEQRLVACANIMDGVSSYYWWDGAVQNDQEYVVIAKTQDKLVEEATALIKQRHSYNVPCVVSVPLTGGNPDFLNWIERETTSGKGEPDSDLEDVFVPDGA